MFLRIGAMNLIAIALPNYEMKQGGKIAILIITLNGI